MLNYETLLIWTAEAVSLANEEGNRRVASALDVAAKAHSARGNDPMRRTWIHMHLVHAKVPQLTLTTRLGFDRDGRLALAAPKVESAEARALIACHELFYTKLVQVGRCQRSDCRRFFVHDFGAKGRKRPRQYCTLPNGKSHRLSGSERTEKSRKGDVSQAAIMNRRASRIQRRR